MNNDNYRPAGQYAPISAWGYVGYNLLFCIPIIGWIFLIVFTFSSANINRRSYARSFWCMTLIAIVIFAIVMVATGYNINQMIEAMGYR